MTEKIARRGIRPPTDYIADTLSQILVRDIGSQSPVSLAADDLVDSVRHWIASGADGSSHQGYPVLDAGGMLLGVLTRRDIISDSPPSEKVNADAAVPLPRRVADLIRRSPKFVYDDCTVRQAADHMANHGIGRLPVVSRTTRSRGGNDHAERHSGLLSPDGRGTATHPSHGCVAMAGTREKPTTFAKASESKVLWPS